MNLQLEILAAATLVVVAGCSNDVTSSSEASMSLEERVLRIEKQVVDLTAPSDLLLCSEFREVFDSPSRGHVESVIKYLAGTGTEQQKIIAGLSVHRLDLPGFLDFSRRACSLLEEGRLSGRVFRHVVFAPYEWNTELPVNYSHREVREFLEQVARSPCVEDALRRIVTEQYLTGKAKAFIENR